MLVSGASTRQETRARVVVLRGKKCDFMRGGYSPLSISAEGVN